MKLDDNDRNAIMRPNCGTINGHEWVDMGLSVKWATCNIGASSPSESGDYFAWGETEPKSKYTWDSYKFCVANGVSNGSLSKYTENVDWCDENLRRPLGTRNDLGSHINIISREEDEVDHKTCLDLSDDAARYNWGDTWRIPTIEEFEELKGNCIWEPFRNEGKLGFKGTSMINGNSIILPNTSWWSEELHSEDVGCYWSSSLKRDQPYDAYGIEFGWYDYYHNYVLEWAVVSRCYGLPVRPVIQVDSPDSTTVSGGDEI